MGLPVLTEAMFNKKLGSRRKKIYNQKIPVPSLKQERDLQIK